MKVGFIQFAPVLGNVQANIRKISELIIHAKRADLIVLPELSNSGYNFESREQARATSEEIPTGVFVNFLASLCRENNLHIVSGLNERDNDCLYNTAVLIGPQGFIGKYRKLHLFLNEKDYFIPGDVGLPVFDIGSCKIGILICFDWIFPEVWRILAMKGADIICHPSNLIIPGLGQKAVAIHAVTNRVFVVLANRIGAERDFTFTGMSTVADPKAHVLVQASGTEEEVKVVDIDVSLARDKMVTPRNHVFADRRPQEYTYLIES